LVCHIQHILGIEKSDDGVEETVAVLPDHSRGRIRGISKQHAGPARDLHRANRGAWRDGHRERRPQVTQQPDLIGQFGRNARLAEQERFDL